MATAKAARSAPALLRTRTSGTPAADVFSVARTCDLEQEANTSKRTAETPVFIPVLLFTDARFLISASGMCDCFSGNHHEAGSFALVVSSLESGAVNDAGLRFRSLQDVTNLFGDVTGLFCAINVMNVCFRKV